MTFFVRFVFALSRALAAGVGLGTLLAGVAAMILGTFALVASTSGAIIPWWGLIPIGILLFLVGAAILELVLFNRMTLAGLLKLRETSP